MNEAQVFSLHVVTTTPLAYRPDFSASLAEQHCRGFQVVVVDATLGGQAKEGIQATTIEFVHLRNFRKVSYARGHNQAIAFALQRWPQEVWDDRYIVLARTETAFDPGCLEKLLQAFQADPALMLAGPKMLIAEAVPPGDGEDWVEMRMTPTLYELGYNITKYRTLRYREAGTEDAGQSRLPEEVFGCSEPCVVIRASALASLREGPDRWFDEGLPRGQELVDLFWRAHGQGLLCQVVPDARIWFSPAEAREQPKQRERVYLAGPVRDKNDHALLEFMQLPWVMASMLRSAAFLLTHPRALRERIRNWSIWHRERGKTVQPKAPTVSLTQMRRWFL